MNRDRPDALVARTWRGQTRAQDAQLYADYVLRTGIAAYRSVPGNLGAHLLYRFNDDVAEFLVISFWDSLESIAGFAGPDVETAVFYPEDDEWLVQRDMVAHHWSVLS